MPMTAEQAVAESFERLRQRQDKERVEEMARLEAWYKGGPDMTTDPFLTRRLGEGKSLTDPRTAWDLWNKRKERAHYPNYVRRLADAFISRTGGAEIKRTPENEDETWERFVAGNRAQVWQNEMAQGQSVMGNAWMLHAYRERSQTVRLFPVHPTQMTYQYDADDPDRLLVAIETRERTGADGNSIKQHWVWTEESGRLFDDHGARLDEGEFEPNPFRDSAGFGVIPYTHLLGRRCIGVSDGISPIRDQVTLQKAILNRASDLDELIFYQAGGLGWVKGVDFKSPLEIGPTGMLDLGDTGEVGFAAPAANIQAVAESIEKLIDWMFQTGHVPIDVVKGTVAESGVALVIKWQPFRHAVDDLRSEWEAWEDWSMKTSAAVGGFYGVNLPEMVDLEWMSEVVPTDNLGEREQDRQDVVAGLLTRREYVRRWHGPETEDELDAIMADLDTDQATAATNEANRLAGAFGLNGNGGIEGGI